MVADSWARLRLTLCLQKGKIPPTPNHPPVSSLYMLALPPWGSRERNLRVGVQGLCQLGHIRQWLRGKSAAMVSMQSGELNLTQMEFQFHSLTG